MFEYGDKHGYFIKSSKTGLFWKLIMLFYFFGLRQFFLLIVVAKVENLGQVEIRTHEIGVSLASKDLK